MKYTFMKYRIVLIFAILWSFSCKKKDADKQEYTVSGVLYDFDGETPVSEKTIELWVESDRSRLQHKDDINFSAMTVTDANGVFEFKYKELRGAENKLTIAPPASETPVMGVILKNIPANENIDRDVCFCSEYELVVNANINASKSDTIFTNLRSDVFLVYPFDTALKISWDKSYGVHSNGFFWGINRTDYMRMDSLFYAGLFESEEFQKQYVKYEYQGFPYVSSVDISE